VWEDFHVVDAVDPPVTGRCLPIADFVRMIQTKPGYWVEVELPAGFVIPNEWET
jgi:hypothetical protein